MTDIICDIDGTLMNVEARRKLAVSQKRDSDKVMNWDVFLDPQNMLELDTPQSDVVMVIKALYNEYNFMIVFTAGFTPIPFKLFTISAGAFHVNFPLFIFFS